MEPPKESRAWIIWQRAVAIGIGLVTASLILGPAYLGYTDPVIDAATADPKIPKPPVPTPEPQPPKMLAEPIEKPKLPPRLGPTTAELNIDGIAGQTSGLEATPERIRSLASYLGVTEEEARQIFERGTYEKDGQTYKVWKSDFRDCAEEKDGLHLSAFFLTPMR